MYSSPSALIRSTCWYRFGIDSLQSVIVSLLSTQPYALFTEIVLPLLALLVALRVHTVVSHYLAD